MLRGDLFDSAIMKTSVISPEFRQRRLSNSDDPDAFEGPAVVFDGPEDYHARIDDPTLGVTPGTLLFMRGAGPIGYPGAAVVVNMRPPAYLTREGVGALPCIGDGRQSGTSGGPPILNASPEAAAMGGLALIRTGDRVRIDLARGTADVPIPDEELADRRRALTEAGGYRCPGSQTPWQAIQRSLAGQLDTGAILEGAEAFQRLAQRAGPPRDNHWRRRGCGTPAPVDRRNGLAALAPRGSSARADLPARTMVAAPRRFEGRRPGPIPAARLRLRLKEIWLDHFETTSRPDRGLRSSTGDGRSTGGASAVPNRTQPVTTPEEGGENARIIAVQMVPPTGLEPVTPALRMRCSTS